MMIGLVAHPWWVNLLLLVPPLAWFSWRRGGVPVTVRQLVISGVFAASFGFLEAVVVVYLRAAVALLTSTKSRARAAVFLWTFAIWDIVYYAALWATVRWPLSLSDPDVLFLIPVPWLSPVWFPLLVSALALAAVLLVRVTPSKS